MAKKKYTENPCITFTDKDDHPHLKVFDHFYIDKDLPKYKNKKTDNLDDMDMTVEKTPVDTETSKVQLLSTIPSIESWDRTHPNNYIRAMDEAISKIKDNRSLIQKIIDFFKPKTNIEETFKNIKSSLESCDTQELKESAYIVYQMLEKINKIGQKRQVERIKQAYNVLVCELVLAKKNKLKYITEQHAIDFMLKSEFGVCVDFIGTYCNVIPLHILDKIEESHNEKIFDNYCIMYYDKTLTPFRHIQIAAEEIKKRDPILFGMLDGSRKLYYVTDWVYKDDDLTLEKLESITGKKAIHDTSLSEYTSINIDSLNTFITTTLDNSIRLVNNNTPK